MPEQGNTARLEASAAYAERHQVFQLFESLLQQLVIHKPADPVSFLIKSIQASDAPHIIIAGTPGADLHTQAELLAGKLNVVHVIAGDVWNDAAKQGSTLGQEAKALIEAGEQLKPEMIKKLVFEKLCSKECMEQGWVLEGFPSNASEAHQMVKAGMLPTTVLHLVLDEKEASRRLIGRRVDEKESKVYHTTDNPPPNDKVADRLIHRPDDMPERVAERLVAARQAEAALRQSFHSTIKVVDGSLPSAQLLEEILPKICTKMPSRAPRGCPRVALLGGPGSGTLDLAKRASARYGAICVSARELLHTAFLGGGSKAKRIAPFMKDRVPSLSATMSVPDDVLLPLVLGRLSQQDVRKRGFVLEGFPATGSQAKGLSGAGIWLRHTVLLDLPLDVASERLKAARIDPVDGKEYHPATSWPSDPDVAARLLEHPHQSEAEVREAISLWADGQAALLAASSDVITEEASSDPLALEERLSSFF